MRPLGHRLRLLAARDQLWLDIDSAGQPGPRVIDPPWATPAEVGSVLVLHGTELLRLLVLQISSKLCGTQFFDTLGVSVVGWLGQLGCHNTRTVSSPIESMDRR